MGLRSAMAKSMLWLAVAVALVGALGYPVNDELVELGEGDPLKDALRSINDAVATSERSAEARIDSQPTTNVAGGLEAAINKAASFRKAQAAKFAKRWNGSAQDQKKVNAKVAVERELAEAQGDVNTAENKKAVAKAMLPESVTAMKNLLSATIKDDEKRAEGDHYKSPLDHAIDIISAVRNKEKTKAKIQAELSKAQSSVELAESNDAVDEMDAFIQLATTPAPPAPAAKPAAKPASKAKAAAKKPAAGGKLAAAPAAKKFAMSPPPPPQPPVVTVKHSTPPPPHIASASKAAPATGLSAALAAAASGIKPAPKNIPVAVDPADIQAEVKKIQEHHVSKEDMKKDIAKKTIAWDKLPKDHSKDPVKGATVHKNTPKATTPAAAKPAAKPAAKTAASPAPAPASSRL